MNAAAPDAPQTPPAWTAADGKLLRGLRERAGLDRGAFARTCTISAAQLTELEDGGHGRFYNDRIKAHTGRNLLRKLGHVPEPVVVVPPPAAVEPDVAAAPQDASIPAQAQAQAMAPDLAPAPVPAPVPTPAPDIAAARPMAGPATRAPWALRAGIAVAVVAALVAILLPRAPRETRVVAEAAPAMAPASLPASSAALAPAGAASEAATAAEAPGPGAPAASASVSAAGPAAATPPASPAPRAETNAATSQAGCDLPPRDKAVPFTPPSALRPNNYVYIESAREAPVCVVDSQNRQTVSVVRPGEGASVYGTPPFLVQSRQWAELRVFYQGMRVTLDGPAPPLAVLLNPR